MIRFFVRRALQGLLVIWLITIVLFGMFFVAPSNVAQTLGGRQATPETIALINQRLGLDRPLWQQYLTFIGNALHGDLGYDYYKQIPVTSIIAEALPKTISIAVGAAVIWLILGVTNGVVSAVRPRSFVDRGLTVFALFFYSMPTFLLGLLLLYYLYFQLTLVGIRIFPAGGYTEFSTSPGGWLQHMILPWITVALVSAAAYTRLTRTSMLEALSEDYIRTARSKASRNGGWCCAMGSAARSRPWSPSSASTSPRCWAASSSPRPSSRSTASAAPRSSRSRSRTSR